MTAQGVYTHHVSREILCPSPGTTTLLSLENVSSCRMGLSDIECGIDFAHGMPCFLQETFAPYLLNLTIFCKSHLIKL